jgi:NAD(P)H dehydrogenase (quinone)
MKVLIVYYSLYGHVFKLAQAVKEGAESVKGAEVLFRRVEEFDIVLKKTADDEYLSQVRQQQKDIPVAPSTTCAQLTACSLARRLATAI